MAVRLLTSKASAFLAKPAVQLNSQVIPMKAVAIGQDTRDQCGRHLVFLHGIFGKAMSFRFLAKKREIHENFTVHLLDMRNHGSSGWHFDMDYQSMAHDLYVYLEQQRLTDQERPVSIVGHSMGGKVAMTFAGLFPELVHQLVSLDSPPVDRSHLPEINKSLDLLLDGALEVGDLQHLGFEGARKHIEATVKDRVLREALIFNLEDDATWSANFAALNANKKALLAFENVGPYFGPTLFINGANSYQRPIQADINFYRTVFPNATNDDLIEVADAGHGVHFDQPIVVGKHLHSFLVKNLI